MSKAVKIIIAVAVIAAAAFAFMSGQKGEEAGTTAASGGGTLRFGVTNFADSLETTDNYFGWVVMRYGLGECLVKFDKKMNAVPWLAKSWKISDDGLTWTFVIDDRATFSNGKKMTAMDAKKTIERTFEKAARAKAMFEYDEIRADGQTLYVKTKRPVPTLPGMLGDPLFIIIDTDVKDRDYAKEGPICTGPYMVKEYSKAKAVMERNPHYWDGEVPYDVVEIPTIDDPNTRAMALQSGEIDMAINIAPGDLSLFSDEKAFNISSIASLRVVLARLNSAEGRPLHDKRVRQALLSALDRETYCKVLLKGTFVPGGPAIPPSMDYGFDTFKDPNSYNPERAKQLLAEAGWKDTDGDGYVDKDGKPLELEFIFYSGRAELPLFAEATQSDAKNVGIKINLKNVDYNVLDGIGVRGEYDLLISNILAAQAGDPEVFINQYWKTNVNGSNPQNGSGYSNAEFDALSDRLAVEFDPAKRRELVIKMQQILLDDAATIIFGHPETNMVSSKAVANAEILPCDYYWLTKEIKPAAAK